MTYDPWTSEADKHERTQFSDIRDMKFKDDSEHHIRIMPSIEEDSLPFYGYVIHWIPQQTSKKGRPIVHKKENRCGVCKYVSDLWTEINRLKEEEDLTEKSPQVKAVYEKVQAVGGKEKYDFNVLDRDDMEHEVETDGKKTKMIAAKRMTTPSTIWQSIFNYAKNKKWGSPSDKKTGYDFEIITEGKGARRQYTVAPDRTSSPLSKDEIEALDTCYDLAKLRKPTSAKDIKEILENAKSPYDDIISYLSDEDEEVEKPKKKRDEEEVEEPKKKRDEEEVEEPKKKRDDEDEEVEKPKKKRDEDEEVEKPKKKRDEDEEVEKPKKKRDEDEEDNNKEESEKEDEKRDEDEKEDENENEKKDGDEDKYNLENYECKGDYEESEELCRDCPVKKDCIKFQPYFKKAKGLKINVGPERNIADIIKDVKSKEPKEEEPKEERSDKDKKDEPRKLGKRKTDLPF